MKTNQNSKGSLEQKRKQFNKKFKKIQRKKFRKQFEKLPLNIQMFFIHLANQYIQFSIKGDRINSNALLSLFEIATRFHIITFHQLDAIKYINDIYLKIKAYPNFILMK